MRATLNETSPHLMNIRPRTKSNQPSRHMINLSIWYIVVLIIVIAMLLPLFWMITIALKSNNDIFHLPPQFFPHEFQWENFINGPIAINFGLLFVNSVLITVLSTIGAVASSMFVGYGLARIRFPGRKIWFYIFVGSMMLPGIVTLLPLFHLYLSLNWYDTWLPLIAPSFFGNPLYIFLARQFYLSVPFSLDEAAKIDGAGHLRIFWHIMVPITRPIWITMAIMTFTTTWNDYLNPLIYLNTNSKWTLSLGMASFAGAFAGVAATPWNQYMATNIIYMLPPLIVFFVAQRYFIQGLSALNTSASK
ncbi:MAG TPA: carbohydrate ABC transporter permease [Ktedonobacteraceae bacterium]|nr:carbohydrate ABC transporter permease [Ktedonobacteraceae bacterium]